MILRAFAAIAAVLWLAAPALAQPLSSRSANYTIDVTLDPAGRSLAGRESIMWTNTTAASTDELQFHLYYNAWRDRHSTWMREQRLTSWWDRAGRTRDTDVGSIEITRLTVAPSADQPPTDLTGAMRFIAPDDGNPHDRTVMSVALPATLHPGQSLTIDIGFTAKIPRPIARTGAIGNYFFLAQWFPKLGVLEPSGRWNCHQFHVGTEFFADFGVYDVRMTVPRGWLVGATGREVERIVNADGTASHRYRQEDVHDFAWTTSPDFLEYRDDFEHPGLPAVEMRLLLQPEHRAQAARHFEATRTALRYYGEWIGPYPYGHITIVDPAWQSATGGMEYPTLFTAGTSWIMPEEDVQLEDVIIHEAGHQWWYGMVATNEFEDAWMDEGINQYVNARVMADTAAHGRQVPRFFGGFLPWPLEFVRWDRLLFGDYLASYRRNPTADTPSTPSFQYWPGAIGEMAYAKPSLWLHTLERALGWPVMQQILATYFDRWKFRHPAPADFFQIANEVSRRDLTPYFDQVYRGSAVFDYGIEDVTSTLQDGGGYRTDIVARRYGDGIFPLSILLTLENGEQRRFAWNGGDRWHRVTIDHASRAASAQVDPDRVLLLDTNFTNNSFTLQPAGPRAAARWAAVWMVWLQDQLLTWMLLV